MLCTVLQRKNNAQSCAPLQCDLFTTGFFIMCVHNKLPESVNCISLPSVPMSILIPLQQLCYVSLELCCNQKWANLKGKIHFSSFCWKEFVHFSPPPSIFISLSLSPSLLSFDSLKMILKTFGLLYCWKGKSFSTLRAVTVYYRVISWL